jgi:type III pantothenate kinase
VILELDMGNTRIKWRLRGDSGKVARGNLPSMSPWLDLAQAVNIALKDFGGTSLERILVASVLGEARNQDFLVWCKTEFALCPEFARSQSSAGGVVNGYLNPERLGVDRWLVILASFNFAREACVIADCGSALTVDLIDGEGRHLGGYIAPGLQIMRRALRLNTEGVLVDELSYALALTPGRDTESAVCAAQGAMTCGLLERALLQLRELTNCDVPKLFVTGGDAERLLSYFPEAIWRPELVLDGLALALPVN